MNFNQTDGRKLFSSADFNTVLAETNQANTLLEQGQFEKARQILENVVSQKNDFVRPWCMLGFIHASENRADQAVSCFAKAHFLCPLNAGILLDLAKAQKTNMMWEAAIVSLEKCKRIAPDSVDVLVLLGDAYWTEGHLERANKAFSDALNVDQSNLKALIGLAQVHQDGGDSDLAISAYKQLLTRPDTDHNRSFKFQAAYHLIDLGQDISEDDILHYSDASGDESHQRDLNFARAWLNLNKGKWKEAWQFLVAANQGARNLGIAESESQFSRRALALEYAQAQSLPTSPPNENENGPRLVYIAGASRSGKTTLERLLAHSSDVQRTYEMATIDRAVLRVAQVTGMPNVVDPWFMEDISDDVLREMFLNYARSLSRSKKCLTNTNPGNIKHFGLVARLAPSAKFIFVKRSRADQVFRIFLYNYGEGNSYATDIKTIERYIDWYEKMIQVWMAKMPERCKLVTYEEMVQDPTGTLADIAEFADLKVELDDVQIADDCGCGKPFMKFMQLDETRQ